jgi:hypothetical protein
MLSLCIKYIKRLPEWHLPARSAVARAEQSDAKKVVESAKGWNPQTRDPRLAKPEAGMVTEMALRFRAAMRKHAGCSA